MIKKMLFTMGAFVLSASLHAMNPEQFLQEHPVLFALGMIDNQTEHALDVIDHNNNILAEVESRRSVQLCMNVFGQFDWTGREQYFLSDPVRFVFNNTGESLELSVHIFPPYEGSVEIKAVLFEEIIGDLSELTEKSLIIDLNELANSCFMVDVVFDVDQETVIEQTEIFISKD